MAYYFMLGVVPLPITPGALSIKTPSMNKTINLVNEGEINIPKDRGLREISFEFLLPQVQKYPFANYQLGSYTATAMIPILNLWKQTKLPFQFIVVRTSPSGKILYFTNIKCLIEDYTYDEDAEEYGLDVMCSINLKEYKDYGTKSVKLKEVKNSDGSTTKTATQTNTRSTTGKTVKSSVKTQDGDTLANIAKKETGSFDNYEILGRANNIVMPEDEFALTDRLTGSSGESLLNKTVGEVTSAPYISDSMGVMTPSGTEVSANELLKNFGVASPVDSITVPPAEVKIPVTRTDGFSTVTEWVKQ